MKVITILILATFAVAPAMAQEAQSYTPWTVDANTAQILNNALGEMPAKYANPLLNFLAQKESVAAADAKAAKAAKDAPPPAPVAPEKK